MSDYFTINLIKWSKRSKRDYPWVGEKDPYLIWLSEIILQQTRVEQGLSYFQKFKSTFPTISELANASEDQILRLWQGLGYYSRARNLHTTAKHVTNELNGVFPYTYESIIELKGVGPYTAAAIASFAYDLPHAVVDGNVIRLLSRYYGIETPVDERDTLNKIKSLASELIDRSQPGIYNQAIMDFGATVCKPAQPKCEGCPFQTKCAAFKKDLVNAIPRKSKKVKKRNRYFNYLVMEHNSSLLIHKRVGSDIWKHLHEFPLIESNKIFNKADLKKNDDWKSLIQEASYEVIEVSDGIKHVLTHQTIYARFFRINVDKQFFKNNLSFSCVKIKNLNTFAFPKLIDCYLQNRFLN